ncbi:unnamed protein product [Adineta steineri]|uniref:G-protein coupled receptors family 1 profile domain-containing protein n=1 Tax=Adineta steineri TaxID=433720 RepID=A0A813QXK9_9BILA|nr:unnamed protein product [Adineta steineri]CAF1196792.1 unnamed protein product [Adineta steineri]
MSAATIINAVGLQFSRFGPLVVFIFGVPGNIFNILIFTRPHLIKNPCSTYFFCASLVNLNVLFLGLIPRSLADGFGIDPVSNNLAFCRFRYFILHPSLALSSWFTILAGIDRYCISSRDVHRRLLSNLKYSRYISTITTFIGFAIYSHLLGLFVMQQLKTGPYCYALVGPYRVFYDFFYFATYSFTPPIIMVFVGLATYYNVRQTRSQIVPVVTNNTNRGQLKRRDRQLLKMTCIQFICTIILTLPVAIQKLYATFTQNNVKGTTQVAIESFITILLRVFLYTNASTSFYIFTLSGSVYRKEFLCIIIKIIGCIFGKHSSIYRRFYVRIERSFNGNTVAINGQTVTMNETNAPVGQYRGNTMMLEVNE